MPTAFYSVDSGGLEIDLDRSDEVRGPEVRGSGSIEVRVPAEVAGRILCAAHHPLALELGTIPPGVPCCTSCTLYS